MPSSSTPRGCRRAASCAVRAAAATSPKPHVSGSPSARARPPSARSRRNSSCVGTSVSHAGAEARAFIVRRAFSARCGALSREAAILDRMPEPPRSRPAFLRLRSLSLLLLAAPAPLFAQRDATVEKLIELGRTDNRVEQHLDYLT